MAYQTGREPDHEYATRTGELGLLIYSIGRHDYLLVNSRVDSTLQLPLSPAPYFLSSLGEMPVS
jgi:hypothetical protein